MDLTGKGLHKGRPNLFADIVERRKHEGDFQGIWRSARRSAPGGNYWVRRAVGLFGLCIAAVLVFAMILPAYIVNKKPERSDVPAGANAATGPARAPERPRRPPGLIAGAGLEPAASAHPDEAGGAKPGPAAASDGDAHAKPDANAGAGEPGDAGVEEDSPEEAADPGPVATNDRGEALDVVREGGRFVFRPPLAEFKPLKELDLDFIDEYTWDDAQDPTASSQIKLESKVVAHIYRYLRTHGSDLRLRVDPGLTHGDLMRQPGLYRGKAISLRVKLVMKYKNFGWPDNDSGVRDTGMLFCQPVNAVHGRGLFVVLTPQPLEDFRIEEIYDLTGVFWKRYFYPRTDSDAWQAQPLILTMEMTPAAPPPEDSFKVTTAIIAVAAVLIIGLLFLVRGETREGQAKRAERIERRRRQQQKLGGLRPGGLAPLQPAGGPPGKDAAPPAPPPEGAAGRDGDEGRTGA